MKILLVSDQYPPFYFGGMSQHTYHLANNLSELGHQVLLILPKHFKADQKTSNLEIRSVLRSNYLVNTIILGIVKKKWKPELQHIVTAGMFYPSLIGPEPTIQRVVGNDFLRPWRGLGLFYRKYIYGIPLIGSFLGQVDLIVRQKFINVELSMADLIIANSEWTSKRLVEEGLKQAKILCLIGGVDLKVFRSDIEIASVKNELKLSADRVYLMTAGNLIGKKGFDTVLKALPAVLAAGHDISYLIAGEGPEKEKLKELVTKLKLEDRVKFLGALSQEELAKYMGVCAIYVQVSRNNNMGLGTVDVETMGRTFIEAGACGIPVIAANIGGIPSVVRHGYNGILIDDSEDFNTLSSRIIDLLANPCELNQLGSNGLLRAKTEFDWKILTQRILVEFKNIENRKKFRSSN